MVSSRAEPICDGSLEIVQIDEQLTPKTIEFFKANFLRYENVCSANNILGCEQATSEMIIWLKFLLEDRISFAVLDVKTKEIVAISINRIMSPIAEENLGNLFSKFKAPAFKFIIEYVERLELDFNIFEKWNIESAFEIAFLSTSQDYSGRGLATILSNYSINIARQMLAGTLPYQTDLPAHIRDQKPQAVCSIFSSLYTQKIGNKLGFQTLNSEPHKEFMIGDKNFYELLDKKHEIGTFAAIRL